MCRSPTSRRSARPTQEFGKHYPRWLETKVKAAGVDEQALLAPFTLEKLKDAVDQSAVHARNFHKVDDGGPASAFVDASRAWWIPVSRCGSRSRTSSA